MSENDIILTRLSSGEHVKEAAALIYETDEHLFYYLYGNSKEAALQFLEAEWQQDIGIFSHSLCTVAMRGTELVGIELGFDNDTENEANTKSNHAGFFALSQENRDHLLQAVPYLPYLIPPYPKDAYLLQNLASSPKARGLGIGRRLITNAIDNAREKGYKQLQLDVYVDNPAVEFYHHMGLEIVSEVRVPHFEANGISSHYRMTKIL